jgi:hypothetical protein
MNAKEALIAAELASHAFTGEDGHRSIAMNTNEVAAERAITALADAGYSVIKLPELDDLSWAFKMLYDTYPNNESPNRDVMAFACLSLMRQLDEINGG